MDKATVIGGSGFLGSHVADELTARGFAVTVFDREPSPWIKTDQQMIVGDMLNLEELTSACDDARYVYHFAGIADIAEARASPYRAVKANIMGVTTALEVARSVMADRFVFASTMYVYSVAGSIYRASKQAAEIIIEAYGDSFGLNYTLLRYGSLYGPRAQDWNGLRGYVRQIIEEGRLSYSGTGAERREYIHVCDAARLSVDVLGDQHSNQAITVTGTQVLNSRDLVDMIFEIVGKKSDVVFSESDGSTAHYRVTPYRYSPRQAKKLVPSEFIDLGQGILDLCEEIAAIGESD
jgi:UDP-glucose 4-epimerase